MPSLRGTGFNVLTFISPVGMIAVAFAFCLICVVLPPVPYEKYMQEPDFMFLNVNLISFYAATCLCFLGGFFLLGGNSENRSIIKRAAHRLPAASVGRNKLYHLAPLVIVALLNAYSAMMLLKNTPGLINLVLSGSGEAAKQSIDATGGLAGVQPLLIAIIWWAMGKHMTMFPNLKSRPAKLSAFVIGMSIFLAVVIAVVKVARYEIMPLLAGCLIVYLIFSARSGVMSVQRFFGIGVGACIAVALIFMAFSAIRGHTSDFEMQRSLYGYGPTAFNHLVAVLDGRLVFPAAHTGTYTFAWVSNPPFVYQFLNTQEWFGLPDTREVFNGEFEATRAAGLQSAYNWITGPGYYLMDWGDWYYIFMVVLGGISCLLWKLALRGATSGLILYPFMAGTILLWFGFAGFTKQQLATYLMMIGFLVLYDRVFARRRTVMRRVTVEGTPDAILQPGMGGAEPTNGTSDRKSV